jgi:ribonuclease PH
MRADGRAADELRPVEFEVDFVQNPAGSVLVRVGRTIVNCTVHVEEQVPAFRRGSGRGWVTAEYSLLPGSTETRSPRESERGQVKGRTHEIQRLIGRSLRAVVDLAALGERALYADCDVLQADGGTRTAAITGAYIALARACQRLRRAGYLERDPLRDSVAAVSVGIVAGEALLDLPYQEDARAQVDMNVVMTGSGRLIEVQGTGEEATFSRAELDRMLDLATKGIGELTQLQRKALGA